MSRATFLSFIIIGAGVLTVPVQGGSNSGKVNVVNVNRSLNGLAVQLNIPLTATYESSCPWNNWIYLPTSDPLYGSSLALLLAAQASGQTVVITSGGCVETPGGAVPIILTIDSGIRSGS